MNPALTLELRVESKLDQVERALGEAALRAGLSAAGNLVEGYAKLNVRARGLIDTGNLVNSIQTGEPEVSGLSGEIEVGTDVEYAKIHEYGGTIVPKKAKFLAIPITDAARRQGPREFPGKLHVVATDTKTSRITMHSAVLADEAGTPQYALVRSVTIPARPYLRPAIDEHRSAIQGAFAANVRRAIEGATR